MAVNLISCSNLIPAFLQAVANLSDEDRAKLCETLNCGVDVASLISAVTPNQLAMAADGGLIVVPQTAEDFLSSDDGNVIVLGKDGKLYVAAIAPSDWVSSESDNILTTDSDGNLYVSGDLIQSMIDMSVAEAVSDLESFISADAPNALIKGSDGKLFVPGVEYTRRDPGEDSDLVPGSLLVVYE